MSKAKTNSYVTSSVDTSKILYLNTSAAVSDSGPLAHRGVHCETRIVWSARAARRLVSVVACEGSVSGDYL